LCLDFGRSPNFDPWSITEPVVGKMCPERNNYDQIKRAIFFGE
jgi:hypothetical protein